MDKLTYDEFVEDLEKSFPKMFPLPYGGVAVGEGWWMIISELCAQINGYVQWKQEQKEKYDRGDGCPDVVVRQVKEKFGGLRFYYDGGDERVQGMVQMAEGWAAHSCEKCGAPGKIRKGGWIRTLCDKHEQERMESLLK